MKNSIPITSHKQWWRWGPGALAFLWILLRSGANPARLTYPCQRAAMPVAFTWLLAVVGFLAGSLFLRRFACWTPVVAVAAGVIWLVGYDATPLRSAPGQIEAVPTWTVENPVSSVFVMDQIPPTSGSLAAGDASVPDEYLTDPAMDTMIAMLENHGTFLHRTVDHPHGVVGADNVVVIKGNFQWTTYNTTSTDRIKGLIWQILRHPDGFTGEIIVADNTQDVGTGINEDDNNSEDPEQSVVDVVRTFWTKGYEVYIMDWSPIWATVADEYSDGDMYDGYVYEEATKISYPKFISPSGDYYVSMRYGIWDDQSAQYDSAQLCIIDFPVVKQHVMAGATIAVKNWIGMLTTAHSSARYGNWELMHYRWFWGTHALVARVMEVTYPRLIFVDAAWINTVNPNTMYGWVNTEMLLASTDPMAVSWYAAKHILTPIATTPSITDPDLPSSRYRNATNRWATYLADSAGLRCTKDSIEISVYDRTVFDGADSDGDGILDGGDNCPDEYNPTQADADWDGVGDLCDVCPGQDDNRDSDDDGLAGCFDNCPFVSNPLQSDWDGDGVGDECDNCLFVANPDQADTNGNGAGDACDPFCCLGRVGDANSTGGDEPTIGDVSVIIDMLFITNTEVACLTEADVNQSGGSYPIRDDITIGDISTLIDYLFITGPSLGLPDCL